MEDRAVRCGSPPSGPFDPAHQAAAETLGHRQYAMLEEGGEDQHAAPRREIHARLLKAEKFEGAALIFIRVGQLHHDRQLAIEGTGGFQPHRSEEHTSELPSLMRISYAVFCLKKKKRYQIQSTEQRTTHR